MCALLQAWAILVLSPGEAPRVGFSPQLSSHLSAAKLLVFSHK